MKYAYTTTQYRPGKFYFTIFERYGSAPRIKELPIASSNPDYATREAAQVAARAYIRQKQINPRYPFTA